MSSLLSQVGKAIYRVTGTPENFLTALRYKVWGFNNENKKHWDNLLPGDILFFHSKGSDSKFIKNPQSCIVGFGVVSSKFYDLSPLWIDEKIDDKSYPHKFSFSEIYLFEDISVNDDWDSTTLDKEENTRQIIVKMLNAAIPLSELPGFPVMGSYSGIKKDNIVKTLLNPSKGLISYEGIHDEEIITTSTELKEIENIAEVLRYAKSLANFSEIKKRIIKSHSSSYNRNGKSLARAEESHFEILFYLLTLLKDRNYKVYFNEHVDLFAYKNNTSLLIEAKSIENKNFRSQARKGIAQLLEYNYFEIAKFKDEHNLHFGNEINLLATSNLPKDNAYIQFINSLSIKTLAVRDNSTISYGDSIDVNLL